MPSVGKITDTNDYNMENNYEEEEELYDNEQNLIKCGEILYYKYNLLISCNYCEEVLNNFDIFSKHLFEKHFNSNLNNNSNKSVNIILEENINDDLLHINELENNVIYYSKYNEKLEDIESIKEINYSHNNSFSGNNETELNEKIAVVEEIDSKEIVMDGKNPINAQNSPIIKNIKEDDKKPLELENVLVVPVLGNSFKQHSESYEEKFYKYCKLFKQNENNEIRNNFNDKFNNIIERSNCKEISNSNQQSILLNNIKLEENNEIFDENVCNIIEDSTISYIENMDIIEQIVSYDDDSQTDNIIVEDVKINLENNNIVKTRKLLNSIENNDIKKDISIDGICNDNKLNCINQKRKNITAISTKINNFYHCPDCPRYYRRFDTLKIHYRIHTGEKNPYTCSICDKSFCAPCKLIQHYRVHTGERPYKCTICPQAFKAKQKLKNHLESHEKGTIKTPSVYVNGVSVLERQPACLPILINNKFITSSEAKKEDGLFHCPLCDRKYRRFESLKEHADVHVETKQYECHICNKRFTKIRSLKFHLKSHTQNKNLRWNGVPITCDYCEKTFNNKYYLNEHLSVHSGKRPYECKTCNKRFVFKSNFVLHERTHSGDKRYQCKYCDMKFIQSTTKLRHERVVHLKLAPFTCRFCQKDFYTSSIYKNHINDHKNDNDDDNQKYIINNDDIEQTIIVDNTEDSIIVVENQNFKVNEFICSHCGAYFLDCGEYIEHCKEHDNINENVIHYMQDDIVESEEIII